MADAASRKQTQINRIIDYMGRWGWITPLTAFQELGITKLATRISEMKDQGIGIYSEYVNVRTRFGEEVRVKRYRLDDTARVMAD